MPAKCTHAITNTVMLMTTLAVLAICPNPDPPCKRRHTEVYRAVRHSEGELTTAHALLWVRARLLNPQTHNPPSLHHMHHLRREILVWEKKLVTCFLSRVMFLCEVVQVVQA